MRLTVIVSTGEELFTEGRLNVSINSKNNRPALILCSLTNDGKAIIYFSFYGIL